MMGESLSRFLLVATPVLVDPNFFRTVVYLIHHDDEGAFGVVINRPSDSSLDQVLPDWAGSSCSPAVVFIGGPVTPEVAIGLQPAASGPAEPVDLSQDPGLVSGARIYAGYSGWGAGQLESELAESAWLVTPATTADIFTDRPDLVWGRAMRRIDPELGIVATFPDEPSLN